MAKILIFVLIILILGLGLYFFSEVKRETQPELLEEFMIEETKTELKPVSKETKGKISITTVYDNYQTDPQLKTGWGFSCLVRQSLGEGGLNILFDTGADSPTLLSNMEKLSIDPKDIDLILLSHIHGDHTGGLEGILERNSQVTVYLPKSFPESFKEDVKNYGAKFVEVDNFTKISDGVYTTGELGTWIKEQSLIIDTDKGLVIITGCSHPGIVNIVKKAKEIIKKEVYLVLGGFHLAGASDSELKGIINDFRKLGVQKSAPCHCSGDRCRELFEEEYGDDFIENGVGLELKI